MTTPPSSGAESRPSLFSVVADRREPPRPGGLPYLMVGVADETYGVPFLRVREVRAAAGLVITPGLADAAERTLRLQDRTLPLFDLRARLGAAAAPAAETRFVVVSTGLAGWLDAPVAVLVDRIGPVVTLDAGEIEPVPDFGEARSDFILGIGRVCGERRYLINVDRLIAQDNANAVRPAPESDPI